MYEKITRHTSQTKKAKYIKTNAPMADWLIGDSSYGIFAIAGKKTLAPEPIEK
jgi:hypothetical protein